MSAKVNNAAIKVVTLDTTTKVKRLQIDGKPVWSTTSRLILNNTGGTLTVTRIKSPNANAPINVNLNNNDLIYEGDELTITSTGPSGYVSTVLTVNGTAITSGSTITVAEADLNIISVWAKPYNISVTNAASTLAYFVTVERTSSPYALGPTGVIGGLGVGGSTMMPIYEGDVLKISAGYIPQGMGGSPEPCYLKINGVATNTVTVTSDIIISISNQQGASGVSYTLNVQSYWENMSTFTALSIPSELQSLFSNHGSTGKISGTIYWGSESSGTFPEGMGGLFGPTSASFSNVSISGGSISWGGGTLTLGRTYDSTNKCVTISGYTGQQNFGGMIGFQNVAVSHIVVTSYTS